METVKLNDENLGLVAEKAAEVLKNGGIIIFPTETSYGLGADALNRNALKKIHLIKKEPMGKPISIIVADAEQAKRFGIMTEKAEKLMREFMPGPLTIVVEKKYSVPEELSSKTIAFRISSNKAAREVCKRFGSAITATSANAHERPAIYSAKEAAEVFRGKVNLVIDAGELQRREASTIYDATNGRVLRRGPISEEQIGNALEK